MGRNLGPLNIKDTYEGLVQISGSDQLTDGSGSAITSLNVTASFASQAGTAGFTPIATSASWADQAGTSGFATTASFAVSSSADSLTLQQVTDNGDSTTNPISIGDGLVASNINIQNKGTTNSVLDDGGNTRSIIIGAGNTGGKESLIVGRGNIIGNGGNSVNNNAIGRNNTVSSDTFVIDNYTLGALNSISGTGTGRVVIGYNNDATGGSYGGVFAGTNNTVGHTNSVVIGGTGLSTTANNQVVVPNLVATQITASNASFTSASIGYLQTITGSAKIIGDAFIILNNDTPTERYAGVIVQDSGSTANTASLLFDGQTNDWFYQYTDDGGVTDEFGVVMFGPGYNTQGAHVYPSNNTILKGTGDHHIVDSSITDDGTDVVVSANISASGYISASTYYGDGSNLSNITTTDNLQQVTDNGASTTNDLTLANVSASGYISASTFYGDGSNLDGITTDTGSLLTTASYSDPLLTFTKGDGTTFDVTISSDPFPYTGSAIISGSLSVEGTLAITGSTAISSSTLGTGSLIDNLGQEGVGTTTAVEHIVYCTQTEYDGITPDDNTMYVISGSGDIVDDLIVSGSMIGDVKTLTDVSGTTTLDCSLGNYFTLAMPAGGSTTLTPSNIQIGQTINIKITQNATASTLAYAASIDFPGGTAFTISTGAGEVDVLTLVSFDGTSLQATGLANFS